VSGPPAPPAATPGQAPSTIDMTGSSERAKMSRGIWSQVTGAYREGVQYGVRHGEPGSRPHHVAPVPAVVTQDAEAIVRQVDTLTAQLATTQAIARMLQATAIEILGELWPGPRYDGVSEDFREMQAKVDVWRARLGGDHA
jgi:hypothetical protein